MQKRQKFTPLEIKIPDRENGRFLTSPIGEKLSNGAGFTLIELLVVIAIIALLMAILMPSLARVRKIASGIACRANVKNISTAWIMYAQDNDSKIVGGDTIGLSHSDWICPPTDGSVDAKKEGLRKGLLFKYLNDVKVYHCPADKRYRKKSLYSGNVFGGYRSYSVAGSMNGQRGWGQNGAVMVTRITQIKRPVEKYVFLEEMEGWSYNGRSWDLDLTSNHWTDPIAIWHNNQSTIGYADGHVEMHRWVDEGTIEMARLQTKTWELQPGDSGDDLRYMQEHYQPKEIIYRSQR